MPEEKNDEGGFKVVDRRSFSADGSRLQEEKAEKRPESARPAPRSSPDPDTFKPENEGYLGEERTDFETLVSYLSTTALFQLGLLPGPGGERIPSDLANGRRTIDLLEILEQKTRGNLTPDEQQVLEAALYELRLTFVEVEKRQAKIRK